MVDTEESLTICDNFNDFSVYKNLIQNKMLKLTTENKS